MTEIKDVLRVWQSGKGIRATADIVRVRRDDRAVVCHRYEPAVKRRIHVISDNGPQFISRDFKEFIRIAAMTHCAGAAQFCVALGSTPGDQ